MYLFRNSCLVFVIGLLIPTLSQAQDVAIDELEKVDPVKVSGSISALNRFYAASGIEDRQENHIWTLSARLNLSIFGIAVPLSGTITSQNSDFTQPYNRLSIRPSYKWAKAHIGYSNMTYSSYTLAGHTFLGGGLELNPGKIRIAATYGRFATAIPLDIPTNQAFVPSFDRFGYGGKVGYGDDKNYIDLMFFTAKDKQESWETIPDSTTVFPGHNMVLGTAWKFTKVKNLTISGEFASSAFTNDVRDETSGKTQPFSILGFDKRTSTTVRDAFKTSIAYSFLGQKVSGTYERIEPEYQTMGAYFFNNDMENITAAYSTSLFKNKLSFSVNGGLQRNNLFDTETSESKRTIAAGNIVYAKNPFSIGINFSNYSAEVRFVLNPSLDSLNAVVVTRSTSIYGSYAFKSKSKDQHLISANLSRQSVSDDFKSQDRTANNTVVTGTLNYTARLSAIGTSITGRFNYNRNDLDGIITTRLGPGISANRKFLNDKMNAQASVNYFTSEGNSTLTTLLTGSITLKSSHAIALNISFIQRSLISTISEGNSTTQNFGETIATINYSYSF